MANRGNNRRRNEETDNTINYVQCDGLVSGKGTILHMSNP